LSATGRFSITAGRFVIGFSMLLVLVCTGCGDDSVSDVTFECTNCEFWTKITDDRASFPAYFPKESDNRRTIAFSSDRGNVENQENIWVVVRGEGNEEDRYHQITNAVEDEFDPAWSPEGDRIAFTRASSGRFDIYVLDVTDFDNPGDEIRVTSETPIPNDTLSLPFRPTGATWVDDDEVLFSNGVDIFIVTLDEANTPVAVTKLIDDPSDYVLSNVSDFIENQATGIRLTEEGANQVYFVSDSRVALGAIEVVAVNTDEDPSAVVNAEIFLEGVPTRVETPRIIGGRPVGTYVVGAKITDDLATETFCDTMMRTVINVFENDTAHVDFGFSNPRGEIALIVNPPSISSFLFLDGVRIPPIETDTTILGCILPGVDHVIKIESIHIIDTVLAGGEIIGLMDSACVKLDPQERLYLRLNVDHVDSVGQSDSACTGFAKAPPSDPPREKSLHVQQHLSILWHYDGASGSYTALSDLSDGHSASPSFPAISPDGTRLAVVVDFEILAVLDVITGEVWEIRIPAEAGINICTREIAYPAWSPDGSRILVSLSHCNDRPSSDHNATEYLMWEVDVESAAVPR